MMVMAVLILSTRARRERILAGSHSGGTAGGAGTKMQTMSSL